LTWFLLVLAAAAAVAYFIWDFRRKAAARAVASSKRVEEMLRAQTPGGDRAETPPAAVPADASSASKNAPASAAALPARERFLGQPETLLYYLLKASLPDHEVFANVSLASVVGSPAGASERERRLAPYHLDFVVCDKNMHIIAAIDVDTAGAADSVGERQFKADCLKQAGIRLVRVSPAALPRREQVYSLVCGL
jgi:hypothetical protein